jgi:type I restriction enzyme S subunit
MSAESKVPAIRFKGFSGEWEEKELRDEIETIGTGKSIFIAEKEKSEKYQYPILGSRSVIGYDSNYDYSGNFILTARVGENAGQLYKHSGKVKITDNTVFIKSENLHYTFCLLTKFDLTKLSFGTGQPLIKASEINNLKLFISICKQEQTKIGNYFQQLDTLIAQHQQKHDKLLNLKKALLEKMFPKQGAKVPEIRFKGFGGEWVEKEFSVIVSRQSAMSKAADLPRVEYEDIVSGKGVLNKDIWEKESSKAGIKFDSGDVLYGKLRPYLKNWLFPDFEGIAVGDFWVLRTNETDNKFVYYLIQTPEFEKAANLSSGSKMPRSDWGLVSKTVFNTPEEITEQDKIGDLFEQLDTLINQHQAQLKKLNNIKQACLEKMFV